MVANLKDKKRVRISFLLIFFVFILSLQSAHAFEVAEENEGLSDAADYKNLEIAVSLSGEATLSKWGELIANLYVSPLETESQTLLSFEKWADPEAVITEKEDSTEFKWKNVEKASFGITADVRTQVIFPSLTKVAFPPTITKNLEYTKASEHVDLTPEIIAKANELVAGKTDALDALFAIGNFVNENVAYDKSYIGKVEKASWVLQNKKGVCQEYATLFIALVRAIGIPARYVTGVAYSNIDKGFGNHAWAEIWLPELGWIPFDPTYAQYCWIDATHVSLSRAEESISAVTYAYPAYAEISVKDLDIQTNVKSKLEKLTPKTDLNIELIQDSIEDGKYTLLEASVKNLYDSYVPLTLMLTKAPSKPYGSNYKNILLGPEESKKVFFILYAPTEEVEEGYRYDSVIEIKTSLNNVANTTLSYSQSYDQGFTLSRALELVEKLTPKEGEEQYNIDLQCKGTKEQFYEDEEIKASCKIKNSGNVPLSDINLCIDNECRTLDLTIGQEKTEEFTVGKEKEDYIATASNDLFSKSSYLGLSILKRPDLKIISLEADSLDYNEGKINVILETQSICKDLEVKINSLQLSADEIELKKELPISFAGKNALGEKIKVSASCKDLLGNEYTDNKEFPVTVTNVPFFAKILQFFMKLFNL